MTTKKQTAGGKKLWNRAKWKAFVPARLTEADKEAIKSLRWSPEDILQSLEDMATAGYKVSLSYSPSEDVHTVSLTGQYREKPNAGLTLSMRHKQRDRAIASVYWCYVDEGGLSDWEERFGSVDEDDW